MVKIICLMGKAGSGKDTVRAKLEEEYGIKHLVPCTTRPRRRNEVDGREYIFVGLGEYREVIRDARVIESRTYNVNAPEKHWHYFHQATDELIADMEDDKLHWWVAVITPECIEKFGLYFGNDNCKFVYIDVPEKMQIDALYKRETRQKNPNYSEMCRRFLSDQNASFTTEGIQDIMEDGDIPAGNFTRIDRTQFAEYEKVPEEVKTILESVGYQE